MFEDTDPATLYKALNYLRAVPGKVFFMDKDGRYVMTSRNSQVIDYHKIGTSILGKTNLEVMPDKDFAKLTYESDMRVIRTGRSEKHIKKTVIDGQVYYSEIIKQPVWNEDNTKIIGLAGIVNDITEIEKAKVKLEQYNLVMKDLIMRDDLTRLYNRQYITQWENIKEKKQSPKISFSNTIPSYISEKLQKYEYNIDNYIQTSEYVADSNEFTCGGMFNNNNQQVKTVNMLPTSKENNTDNIDKIDNTDKDDNINNTDKILGNHEQINDDENFINITNEINYPLSVVVADCNGLKSVNDTLGHYAGDDLIIATAAMLKRVVENKYPVIRTGGDEFLIICENTSSEQVNELIKKLQDISCSYIIHGYPLSISYGVATTMDKTNSLSDIITVADMDMYIAKRKLHKDIGKKR